MRLMVRYPHSLDPRYRARVRKHAIDVDASHDSTSDRLSPPIPDFNPATRQRNPHQISQFTGLKQEYHLSREGFETHRKRNSGTNVNGYLIFHPTMRDSHVISLLFPISPTQPPTMPDRKLKPAIIAPNPRFAAPPLLLPKLLPAIWGLGRPGFFRVFGFAGFTGPERPAEKTGFLRCLFFPLRTESACGQSRFGGWGAHATAGWACLTFGDDD